MVKRVLKAIVLVLVVGLLGFYLYGFRPGAGQNSGTVEINRPAAQVWRYLADDELVKKWVGGLEVIRHLNPETQGAGARMYLEERYGGDVAKMEMTIHTFDAPRHISFTIESAEDPSTGFTESGEYVLVEQHGQTTLTLTASSIYQGFKLRFLEPYITHAAQTKVQEDLARLKSLVEAEPVMNP